MSDSSIWSQKYVRYRLRTLLVMLLVSALSAWFWMGWQAWQAANRPTCQSGLK